MSICLLSSLLTITITRIVFRWFYTKHYIGGITDCQFEPMEVKLLEPDSVYEAIEKVNVIVQ